MMRALYSGVSGLKTHQTKMDVIGNNIANVNTVAFKSSSTTFSEIMYQNISGASGATATKGGVNAKQIGLGVTTGSTSVNITSPGATQTTGDGWDLKITGDSFFVVNNGTENLFTKAGAFYIDGAGNLATKANGYTVMGWQVDPETGDIRKDTVSTLKIMQEKNLTSPPEATTEATCSGILDSNNVQVNSDSGHIMSLGFYDALGYSYTAKFSVKTVDADTKTYTVELTDVLDSNNHSILKDYLAADPDNTLANIFGKETTATRTFDLKPGFTYNGTSFFDSNNVQLTYDATTKTYTGAGNISYTVAEMFGLSGNQVTDFDPANIQQNGQTATYTHTDNLVGYELDFYEGGANAGTFSYIDTAGTESVSFNMSVLGTQFQNINLDFTQAQCYDNGANCTLGTLKGATDKTTGTGKKLGDLTGLEVQEDGRIFGNYDNGNTVLLGQIAVAVFANPSGLEKLGDNCYKPTLNSGEFDGIGQEITADGGKMTSGVLEMSNVDLSTEFTEMITTQRGFQANSRIITTSDTLLEELINLKR